MHSSSICYLIPCNPHRESIFLMIGGIYKIQSVALLVTICHSLPAATLARMRAQKCWDGEQAEPDWEQVSSISCVCDGAHVPVEVTGERVGGGGGRFSCYVLIFQLVPV